MSFARPINLAPLAGVTTAAVRVPLRVLGPTGVAEQTFLFDTGCQITTVSEDVARWLGLPAGGQPVGARGATGGGRGRIVPVRFRFPDGPAGTPGLEVDSTWVVVAGQRNVALLSFGEVHRHFSVRTLEFDAYFIPW